MSQMPVEANVVLTSDNSQYDQSMQSSAQMTSVLATTVDTLTDKISKLTKSASHGFLGIGAADIASISAATAAWASYQHQMTSLNAQAAVTTRTHQDQIRVMDDYTKAVTNLRSKYGTNTSESAALVETISKMTGRTTLKNLKGLTEVFTDMSKATGEQSTGLASSMLQLQKTMGTAITGDNTRKYADQVTYLSKQTSMSATGLTDFANQIAPIGKLLNMNQTEITGIATAFAKAGQDGTTSASAFNKIVSDIAYATQSGSPDLNKYANLVGLTVDKFNELSGSEKILQIFDSLNTMGPRAVTELNRLGLDGMRTMRSITAMSQQTGGLRAGIADAQDALSSDSTSKGANAAKDMYTELAKIRQEVEQIAELFAENFGPALVGALKVVDAIAASFKNLMAGPLGDVIQAVAVFTGGLGTALGSLLSMAGPLATLATAALLFKGSGMRGLVEGFRGSPNVAAPGETQAPGLLRTGSQLANPDKPGSWFQRGMFNRNAELGRFASNILSKGGTVSAERQASLMWQRAVAAPLHAVGWGAKNLGEAIYSPLAFRGYNNPVDRMRLFTDPRSPMDQATDRFLGKPKPQPTPPRWTEPFQRMANWSRFGSFTTTEPTPSAMSRLTDKMALSNLSPYYYDKQGRILGLASQQPPDPNAPKEKVPWGQRNAASIAATESTVLARGLTAASTGLGAFTRILGEAAANTAFLAGKGASNLIGNRNAAFAGGMVLMGSGAGEKTGLNNTLSLALMGGMAGAPGAAVGAGVGLFLDAKNTTKGLDTGLDALKKDTQVSGGSSMVQQYEDYKSSKEDLAKYKHLVEEGKKPLAGFIHPSAMLAQTNDIMSGLFGSSKSEDAQKAIDKSSKKMDTYKDVLLKVAKAMGTPISGSPTDQMQELDNVATRIQPNLERLGITLDDLKNASVLESKNQNGPLGSLDYLIQGVMTPGKNTGLWDRISNKNAAGAEFMANSQYALNHDQDQNAQYRAVTGTVSGLLANGLSYRDIIRQTGAAMTTGMSPEDPEYKLQSGVQEMAQQQLAFQMPFMKPASVVDLEANMLGDQVRLPGGDPQQKLKVDNATNKFVGDMGGQVQHVQQMILAQENFDHQKKRSEDEFKIQQDRNLFEFNLSRDRAQEDFDLQRKWSEQDYQISRTREEFQYNLSRERGAAEFYRSMHRAEQSFAIQKQRNEVEHNHQILLMTEQTAKSAANIYERIAVQRTSSAGFLLFNAQDQLQKMQGQTQNLNKARDMGLSTAAIQQLGFTDPNNAQQLERFISDAASDPGLIKKMNDAISKRLKAARSLVTDQSSQEWQEFQRSYHLSTQHAQQDFERTARQSRKDFKIQMGQMADDYKTMMDNQEADYERNQKHQDTQFATSIKRAADNYATATQNMTDDFARSEKNAQDDLNRMAKTVTGSVMDILNTGLGKLHGGARTQVQELISVFDNLENKLGVKGTQIMVMLSKIFGFDYTPPKLAVQLANSGGRPGQTGSGQGQSSAPVRQAAGGVLPGYTPTVDVHKFTSETGGELHLSGGEAVMVPEWTRAVGGAGAVAEMNRKARAGRFWMGGVLPLPGAQSIEQHHEPEYAKDIWAGDLNWPGRTDWGKPIVAYQSGIARPFDFGYDHSYGRGVMIQGGSSDSLYAHMSSIVKGIAGQLVRAGQTIGYVGDYGNTGNPPTSHLHFELKNGGWNLPWVGNKALTGAPGATGAGLQDLYPEVEKAAASIMGGAPFKPGFWSHKLNKMAMAAVKRWAPSGTGSHQYDNFAPTITGDNNQQIVRSAMKGFGWNEWPSLYQLVMHESGFRNKAQNPSSTAYGMFQFLDGTWPTVGGHKTDDPTLQALYGMRYIKAKYGDPDGAWKHWQSAGSYGDGSIFSGAKKIVVGERGPEAVIPLNGRGADFIAQIIARSSVGTEAKQGVVAGSSPISGHTYYNYQIDRSTNFTGAITVQANDPNQFISQLRTRERTRALTQPSLGGRRV